MTEGYKVKRVLDVRDLELTGKELEERWLNNDETDSLRGLTFEFNYHVLDRTLREHGHVLDPDTVRIKTKNLLDKDSPMTRIDLQGRGIDVDSMLADFVTYQTIYNYLRYVRGVEYEPSSTGKSTGASTLSKACTNIETTAQHELDDRDIFAEGELTAEVDCWAACPSCETRVSVIYWLVKGYCKQCGDGEPRRPETAASGGDD